MKKYKKLKAKSCSSAGGTKGNQCKASPLDKTVARRNRSYKYPEYEAVIAKWKTQGMM